MSRTCSRTGDSVPQWRWRRSWASSRWVCSCPPELARISVGAALVIGGVIWVLGENFGGIFTGSGTDPNSGPLLMLIAAAYWPARAGSARQPGRGIEPVEV